MDRARVRELHNIAHFENIPSILERGILSHRHASRVQHQSVADEDVQARRAETRVPGGFPLHRYACLYVDARNAMLYRLLGVAPLAVLAVDPAVLDLPGVIVSDRNAASGTHGSVLQPRELQRWRKPMSLQSGGTRAGMRCRSDVRRYSFRRGSIRR